MPGTAVDAAIRVVLTGFRLDVKVHAAAGETVAVMGPSGAGKSTLLGALAGLVRLDEGRIAVGERVLDSTTKPRVRTAPMSRGVVLLGQEPRLFPHMTARENIGFGQRARGLARAAAATEADEWLWRVGLDGLGDRRPAELSGGQQQRVAIARALATSPAAVLLDEPLTALDPETADGIRAVLREQLSATRTTAFVSTHSAVDAVALAQRLIVLEDGRVTQEGSVRDVLAVPATRFVAAVAGVNRLEGHFDDGAFVCRGAGGRVIRIALSADTGRGLFRGAGAGEAVAAVFRPSAVRVARVDAPTWTAALRLPTRVTSAAPAHALDSVSSSRSARAVAAGSTGTAGHAMSRAALRGRTGPVPVPESDGPPAGEWLARVTRLEETPAGVRLRTEEPAVAIDLPADEAADLELQPGTPVWLRIAPEDVRLQA